MEYLLISCVAAAAFAQAVTGIGFGLVCAPVLVAVMGPVPGIATTALLASLVNLGTIAAERRHVQIRPALLLLAPALIATPLAAAALQRVDADAAMAAAGLATLAGVGLLAAGVRSQIAAGPQGAIAAGALSATMNVAGGVGGPAAALYGANAGWPAASLRATLQVYLLGVNLVTLAALGLVSVPLELPLALAAGAAAGIAVAGRLPERAARAAVLAVAAAGGLTLLVSAAANAPA